MSTSAMHCAVVGRGRLGTPLTAALRAGGVVVEGALGRGEMPTRVRRRPSSHPLVVLLCVPDAAIAETAGALPPLLASSSDHDEVIVA